MTRRRILFDRAARLPRPFESPLPLSDPRRSTYRGHGPLGQAGRQLLPYANGTWLKETEIPADRSSFGVGAIARPTSPRSARPTSSSRRHSRKAPAGSEARKIGDYYASFMDEAAIEAKGLAPLSPRSTRSPPSTTEAPRPRSSAPRCAPTWTRSTRPTSTPTTCSASGSPRTSTTPPTTRRSCCRAGSACPTGATTSTLAAHGDDPRQVPGPHRHHAEARRHPDAEAKADAHLAARDEDRARRTGAARTRETSPRRTTTGRASRVRDQGARPRLGRVLRRGGPRQAGAFVVWQPSAVTGISALMASEPLESWKDYLDLPRPRASRRCPARRLRRRAFAFYGTVLSGTPAAARPLEARGRRHQQRARRRGRPALRGEVLPARGEGAGRGDGRATSSPPSAGASTRSTGWRRPPRRRPRPSSPCSGRCRLSGQVARLCGARGRARRRVRERRARGAVRVPAEPRASWASRWTAASG